MLIASEPDKFFQTPHYAGHPAVLVRLEAIELDELIDLLTESWPCALLDESSRPSRPKDLGAPLGGVARSARNEF